LATGKIAIYEPPEKGLPFLVVIILGTHVAQSKGVDSRKEAEAVYREWCERYQTRRPSPPPVRKTRKRVLTPRVSKDV
jgi:hypothetical protein